MIKIFAYTVRFFLEVIALLPMRVLYAISTGFYYLLYYVIRYRRDVVKFNIYFAFPQKSKKEKEVIIKNFYRHFCDIFFEIIGLNRRWNNPILKRIRVENFEALDVIQKSDKPVILLSAHFGNWEVPVVLVPKLKHDFLGVFKPLKNPVFNHVIFHNRKNFTTIPVPFNEVYRLILKYQKENKKAFIYLIADQRTIIEHTDYWYIFQDHEVPVQTGPEKLARRLDCPVVYMDVVPEGRGHYAIKFSLITEKPCELPEHQLTHMYFDKLNASIKEFPSFYLWTHKRFMYTRDKITKEMTKRTVFKIAR